MRTQNQWFSPANAPTAAKITKAPKLRAKTTTITTRQAFSIVYLGIYFFITSLVLPFFMNPYRHSQSFRFKRSLMKTLFTDEKRLFKTRLMLKKTYTAHFSSYSIIARALNWHLL